MQDMLVRLYDLPDAHSYYRRASVDAGATVRRAEPWERSIFRSFVEGEFGTRWADEAEAAFARLPITAFVAMREQEIVGFAVFECTRRGYFGPTGVREQLRGHGIGAALLFHCLDAMRETGYAYAIIGGVAEAREFYEKVCGATAISGSDPGVYGA